MKVRLDTINSVKEFVGIMMTIPTDVDLVSGRHAVDAKSIMGIFSLDLSSNLEVQFPAGVSEEEKATCVEAIKQFIVEE